MSSFYVTLPSNSSMHIYEDNTIANFRTVLPKSINLQVDYEVALAELHYPQTLCNVSRGHQTITVTVTTKKPYEVRVVEIPSAVYFNVDYLIAIINALSPEGIFKYIFERASDKCIKFKTEFPDTLLELSPKLALQLGFAPTLGQTKDGKSISPPNLMLGLPRVLFVYCNIVSPQFVGDIMARMLRSVRIDIKTYAHGNQGCESFHVPQYLPVEQTEFQEIEIHIKDFLGFNAPFTTGILSAVLHFRAK
jgi:hypothetical protein